MIISARQNNKVNVDCYLGKDTAKTVGGSEKIIHDTRLSRQRIAHLLLSECLAGTRNPLYEAYLEARIVTPFNCDDPEPGWTPYELASQDEYAVVVFVSGKAAWPTY